MRTTSGVGARSSPFPERCNNAGFRKAIADAWGLVDAKSGWNYTARYEQAVQLLRSGLRLEAREKFRKLFQEAFAKGFLPPTDNDFRTAFVDGTNVAEWVTLMDTAARDGIAAKRRPLVVLLAWQCRQLGDQPLADELLGLALKESANEIERVRTVAMAIEYLWTVGSIEYADRLASELIQLPDLQKEPAIWRLASKIAARRGQTSRQFECLEKALDLEFARMPEVYSVEPIRRDYGELLGHYAWLAKASQDLKTPPPADLLSRTVKAADRWRRLDPEAMSACDQAAKILRSIGGQREADLAWDYLTTPLALRPNESQPWLGLAASATEEGDLALADSCYAAAFGAEPTNAQILWDRAKLLELRGEIAKSRGGDESIAGRRLAARSRFRRIETTSEAGIGEVRNWRATTTTGPCKNKVPLFPRELDEREKSSFPRSAWECCRPRRSASRTAIPNGGDRSARYVRDAERRGRRVPHAERGNGGFRFVEPRVKKGRLSAVGSCIVGS